MTEIKWISTLTCLALMVLVGSGLAAQDAAAFTIGVSPARIETELNVRSKTHSLKIINYGKSATTVKIRVANFDLDDNNQIREIAPRATSLDQWIIIRPLKVRIEAGKSATVRFAIRPSTKPKVGEHRAIIFLEQEPDAGNRDTSSIKVAYRLGVAVYAHVGKKRTSSRLHGVKVTPQGIALDGTASGNKSSRTGGYFAVWPAKQTPPSAQALSKVAALSKLPAGKLQPPKGAVSAGLMTSLPVFPGTRRNILTPLAADLRPGHYKVAISGSFGELNVKRVVDLTIPSK